jgi:aspartate aminotransferase
MRPGSTSARIGSIASATNSLRGFIPTWEKLRIDPDVCDFAFGNPQELAIPGYVDALATAITPRNGDWYAYKRSEPKARTVVASALADWRGMPFDEADIAMTPGAFGAIATALLALVDHGDEVVISVPPWFFYEAMILNAGGRPVKVPVRPDDYNLDVDRIANALHRKTRLVIVNTPNNPTGRVYAAETLKALADVLGQASERFGAPIYLLSDEPYARLLFDDVEFVSPSSYYPYTFIAYSYGKVLLTPGQRIGWLAASPLMPSREALRPAIELAQLAGGWLFPNALLQHAIGDLEHLSLDLQDLQAKRDHFVEALRSYGYELRSPDGTFYLWVRSPEADDISFCQRLADQKVLVLPGSTCEAPGHFRISLTASWDSIERSLPSFAAR